MGKRTALLFLGLLLLAAAPAAAQDDGALPAAFSSDRPGFARSTTTAPVARLITELGVSASFGEEATIGELPHVWLRFGLFDWLEGRVRASNGVGYFFGYRDPLFGLSEPWLGIKIGGRLHEQVSISSDIEVSLPLGTGLVRKPEAELFADLNLDWRFFGPLTLTVNGVIRSGSAWYDPSGGPARYFEGGGSLKFSWQVIDVLTIFVQSYALVDERFDVARVQVGGGLAWRVAPNAQLDASFDIGVTDAGDPPLAQLGATILW